MRTTVLLALLFSAPLFAQAPDPNCAANLSTFVEYAKVKNYKVAFEPWKAVRRNCPGLNVATYIYGKRILEHKIKQADPETRKELSQDLLKLYDETLKYFPGKVSLAKIYSDKAILISSEKLATTQEIYQLLDLAFNQDRKNFKNPKALLLYFSTLIDLHKTGAKDLQAVFDTYDDLTEKIEEESKDLSQVMDQLIPKEEAKSLSAKEKKALRRARVNHNSYTKVNRSIDSQVVLLAGCENLVSLYRRDFETNKEDATWLRRAAARMDAKGCDDPLFVDLVKALDAVEPSVHSKYFLGSLLEKEGKIMDAIKYFDESISLETDHYKKAKKLYHIAVKLRNRQPSRARNYAQRALEYSPSFGAAYLLMASLYANAANNCGSTPFEKRAIYWRAEELARKAGRVDSSLKSKAAAAVNGYAQRAPSKQDIFQAGMAGKTIKFNCWVGGSIKVPEL